MSSAIISRAVVSRTVISRAVVLAAASLMGATPVLQGQESPEVPEEQRVRKLPRQHLAGPRFGFTTFTGDVAQQRADAGLQPIITQFGWQWETQIVSLQGGHQALMEWVFLLGGLGQEEARPTLSWINGIRLNGGVEFGAGPNFGYSDGEIGTAMVIAGGATIQAGDLYIPVTLAVTTAQGGPRITALVGWAIGQ